MPSHSWGYRSDTVSLPVYPTGSQRAAATTASTGRHSREKPRGCCLLPRSWSWPSDYIVLCRGRVREEKSQPRYASAVTFQKAGPEFGRKVMMRQEQGVCLWTLTWRMTGAHGSQSGVLGAGQQDSGGAVQGGKPSGWIRDAGVVLVWFSWRMGLLGGRTCPTILGAGYWVPTQAGCIYCFSVCEHRVRKAYVAFCWQSPPP